MLFDFILRLLHWLWKKLERMIRRKTGTVIPLDTGRRVTLGKQIAEGGFSYVFEAFDCENTLYALKRIHYGPDTERLAACRQEAAVHRAVKNHPNLLPLLGMSITEHCCYMLFPYAPVSLRDTVNRRNPLINAKQCCIIIHYDYSSDCSSTVVRRYGTPIVSSHLCRRAGLARTRLYASRCQD